MPSSGAAKRFLKRHPDKIDPIGLTLTLMEENVFDPRLRTHKLKGDLGGIWASSGGYDVRIVFRFIPTADAEMIALLVDWNSRRGLLIAPGRPLAPQADHKIRFGTKRSTLRSSLLDSLKAVLLVAVFDIVLA